MAARMENAAELAKLSKLLDKVEHEIKRKREDNIYAQTEKFLDHMKKTSDVYSLVTEELIGSLYVMGFVEHTNVLKKLFRGIQQQVSSVLRFSLKYYIHRSLDLEELQTMKDKGSHPEVSSEGILGTRDSLQYVEMNTKRQSTFRPSIAQNLDLRNIPRANNLVKPPAKPNNVAYLNFEGKSSNYGSPLPPPYGPSNSQFKPGNLRSGGHNSQSVMNTQRRDLSQSGYNASVVMDYNEPEFQETELENLKEEHEQMQREIDDLLEGKKVVDNMGSADISSNLKQVLKGLEGFQKKVKALREQDGDDDDEDPEPDLKGITSSMMGAFEKAQKQTAKKVIGYAINKGFDHTKTAEKGTTPDAEMLEAEKKFYRKELEEVLEQKIEEINFTKKRMMLIEQDRNELNDKYLKISLEHSKCEQLQKELEIRMASTEKENENIKSILEDVKKGRVDRLFLSPEKEELLKRNVNAMQNPEELAQVLMARLRESKREAQILKFKLEHGGRDPSPSELENLDDNDILSMTSNDVKGKMNSSFMKKKGGSRGASPEASDSEDQYTDKKQANLKKSTFGANKKKVVIDKNGQRVEVDEVGDNDVYGSQSALDNNDKKVVKGNNGAKMIKVVTKDKNGKDVVQWIQAPADVDSNEDIPNGGTIRAPNGQLLRKVVKKDKYGNEVVEWVAAGDQDYTSDQEEAFNNVRSSGGNKQAKNKEGVMLLQEEVEEEVTIIDENGNEVKVTRKVMKTKEVKKFIDENGEEVIEEEIIDPITGEKTIVRRKVAELGDAKLVNIPMQTMSDATEILYTERGTRKEIKHKEVQTNFDIKQMIQAALESGSIKGEALNEITKLLAKKGVDFQSVIANSKDNKQGVFARMQGQDMRKSGASKEVELEEIEFITKDGRVIKKKIPKGTKNDYEINEDGELVSKDSKRGKSLPVRGRRPKADLPSMANQEQDQEESLVSVTSLDENGNIVHKKKPRKFVQYDQGNSKKPTLDDYIRQQEELEKLNPPATKEEALTRGMYKAMLNKAKQDPKLMDLFKKFMKDKGINIEDEENFVVDFETFKAFMQDFKDKHARCGESCSHLQRFYARIGFYTNWNNRVPLEMKKPDLATEKPKPVKLPAISPRKVTNLKKSTIA